MKTRTRTILVNSSTACYYARRMVYALWELDNLEVAYFADYEAQKQIIEKYQDAKGASFKRAQRAATRGDEDARQIEIIRGKREKILSSMSKVWEVYLNDKTSAKIITLLISSKGDMREIEKRYPKEAVDKAMACWSDYINNMVELGAIRYKENKAKLQEEALMTLKR